MDKVVFLDRDGTINIDTGYISDTKGLEIFAGVSEAIKDLKEAGYKTVIVTNQSGIGRGYFRQEDLEKVNDKILQLIEEEASVKGLPSLTKTIDKIYFCPHSPDENCNCRKPETGMIDDAKKDFNIDIKNSYVIGDKEADVNLGKNAGIKTILVLTGDGEKHRDKCEPDFVAKDLKEAADFILKN